ncbi:MAG: DUF58 domain-containing protein [Pseudomonadota bacterium]|nr:DUF58 domain-containing protein [Pseudomonadota bacterium]
MQTRDVTDENTAQQKGCVSSFAELVALRQPAQSINLHNRRAVSTTSNGAFLSNFRGAGMDFEEVRPYQPGDDLRYLDWRVTARRDKPHTKVFREERERPVIVLVDNRSGMHFGTRTAFKSVIAAQVAALLSWSAVDTGDRIGGVIFTEEEQTVLQPRARQHGALLLLNQLVSAPAPQATQYAPATDAAFVQALRAVRRVSRPNSLLFVISDFAGMSKSIEQELLQLNVHQQITSIMIYDQLEAQLPVQGTYAFTDGNARCQLNTNREVCTQYQHSFDEKRLHLQTWHHQNGLSWLTLRTDEDVVKVLHQAWRARGVRL